MFLQTRLSWSSRWAMDPSVNTIRLGLRSFDVFRERDELLVVDHDVPVLFHRPEHLGKVDAAPLATRCLHLQVALLHGATMLA